MFNRWPNSKPGYDMPFATVNILPLAGTFMKCDHISHRLNKIFFSDGTILWQCSLWMLFTETEDEKHPKTFPAKWDMNDEDDDWWLISLLSISRFQSLDGSKRRKYYFLLLFAKILFLNCLKFEFICSVLTSPVYPFLPPSLFISSHCGILSVKSN